MYIFFIEDKTPKRSLQLELAVSVARFFCSVKKIILMVALNFENVVNINISN